MILTCDEFRMYSFWVVSDKECLAYSRFEPEKDGKKYIIWKGDIEALMVSGIPGCEIPKALHMKPGKDAIKVVRLVDAKEWEDLFTIVGEWCEKYNIQIEEDWLTFLVEDIMSFKEVIG